MTAAAEMERLQERVLSFLVRHTQQRFTDSELADLLGLDDATSVASACEALVAEDAIESSETGDGDPVYGVST